MAHYLNRERMRIVERNDRGNVVYRKMYKFGDEVDTSHIEETHLENLINDGVFVDSEDALTGWRPRIGGAYPGSQAVGAAGVAAADHSDIEDPGASPEEKKAASGDDGDDDLDNPQDVDKYSSMDYAELQAAAKAADVPANQSADDLRAALREHDES